MSSVCESAVQHPKNGLILRLLITRPVDEWCFCFLFPKVGCFRPCSLRNYATRLNAWVSAERVSTDATEQGRRAEMANECESVSVCDCEALHWSHSPHRTYVESHSHLPSPDATGFAFSALAPAPSFASPFVFELFELWAWAWPGSPGSECIFLVKLQILNFDLPRLNSFGIIREFGRIWIFFGMVIFFVIHYQHINPAKFKPSTGNPGICQARSKLNRKNARRTYFIWSLHF